MIHARQDDSAGAVSPPAAPPAAPSAAPPAAPPAAPHTAPPVPPPTASEGAAAAPPASAHVAQQMDAVAMAFVFVLATFIGIGVIRRVSRLLHTPLMSLTNAISAIAVVGAIIVAGDDRYPTGIRILGAVALFASMTNIVSGFLITRRMLVMFNDKPKQGAAR